MAIFYHIDRWNNLKSGQEINLTKFNDIVVPGNTEMTIKFNQKVEEYFANGVSRHGERYFIASIKEEDIKKDKDIIINYDIELIFELERRVKYPQAISRFEAFFAVEKNEVKRMVRSLCKGPQAVKIFQVECEEYLKVDMSLLNKSSSLATIVNADMYWMGESSSNPLYEILLKPPVKILKEVSFKEL